MHSRKLGRLISVSVTLRRESTTTCSEVKLGKREGSARRTSTLMSYSDRCSRARVSTSFSDKLLAKMAATTETLTQWTIYCKAWCKVWCMVRVALEYFELEMEQQVSLSRASAVCHSKVRGRLAGTSITSKTSSNSDNKPPRVRNSGKPKMNQQ